MTNNSQNARVEALKIIDQVEQDHNTFNNNPKLVDTLFDYTRQTVEPLEVADIVNDIKKDTDLPNKNPGKLQRLKYLLISPTGIPITRAVIGRSTDYTISGAQLALATWDASATRGNYAWAALPAVPVVSAAVREWIRSETRQHDWRTLIAPIVLAAASSAGIAYSIHSARRPRAR